MPIYDYDCPNCGPFAVLRPMAEFELPHDCENCGAEAPRAILTAPAISGMSQTRRTAFETNERARHEPRSSKSHGAGCGCCSGGKKSSKAKETTSAPALKSFPSARPWMISH